MIVSNKTLLDDFAQLHSQAVKPLNEWVKKIKAENWQNHNELKKTFLSADYVANGRYVFNIGGNKFRVVAVVLFIGGICEIRFVGTHDEYNKINCSEI
jgi:mRNA interferase HigB